MKPKTQERTKKRINIFGLISLLIFPLLVVVLLIPWYRLFLLRDDLLSTLFIRIVSMAIAGILMIALGIVAIIKGKKQKGAWTGNWTGIVGLILGAVSLGLSSFVIIDYLVTIG